MRGLQRAKKAALTMQPGTRRRGGPIVQDPAASEPVTVHVDNASSRVHTVVSLTCPDRKGLVYDVMRTLHDANARVACGRITTGQGVAELELFVQDAERQQCTDGYDDGVW